MPRHDFLNKAKTVRNDEFYTNRKVIKEELSHYPRAFRDKVVLCPCDTPESEFPKYMVRHFNELGLSKLIFTSWAGSVDLTNPDKEPEEHGRIGIVTRDNLPADPDNLNWDYLEGDGDFRSSEITQYRDMADIIVTNPPFSVMHQFLQWVNDSGKDFLLVAPNTALRAKEVFPLIKAGKVHTGVTSGRAFDRFQVPNNYELTGVETIHEKGKSFIQPNNCLWLTTLPHDSLPGPIKLKTMRENLVHGPYAIRSNGYRTYDGTNILDVPSSNGIPADWDGVMGVPLTFLKKICLQQFQIVGLLDNGKGGYDILKPLINGQQPFVRVAIQRIK